MKMWNEMEPHLHKEQTSIEETTDYYFNPWTTSSNKMIERSGTLLRADHYPSKSTIAPEADLGSWQNQPTPHRWSNDQVVKWSSDDIISLIYDLTEENCDEMSQTAGERRGEKGFQSLLGSDLSRMTEEEFTDLEPNYGRTLFRSIRQLIQTRELQSGDEGIRVKQQDFTRTLSDAYGGEQPKPVQEIIEDDFAMKTCEQLDPDLLGVLGLHGYDAECHSGLNSLHAKDVLKFSSESSHQEQLTKALSSHNAVYTNSSPYSPAYCEIGAISFDPFSELPRRTTAGCYANDLTSASFASSVAGTWPQTPMTHPFISHHTSKKGSCRPMLMTMEQMRTPSIGDVSGAMSANITRKGHLRKRTHYNRGTHLWEFICRLLKTSETLNVQDRIIQWENQTDGVFRIINSKEVARLWGKCKRNELMNYEKLSRALRWCRAYGFLSDLPKEGNLPKKLCFRFGPRAVNWRSCI